jgi:hypothetical protein
MSGFLKKGNATAVEAKKVSYNNHFHGYAPENAPQVMDTLGTISEHSTAALLSHLPLLGAHIDAYPH